MQSSLDQLEAIPPQGAFGEQEHDFLFLPTPAYRKAMLLTTLDCWPFSPEELISLGLLCGQRPAGPTVRRPIRPSGGGPCGQPISADALEERGLMGRPVALVLLNRESQRPGNRGCQRGPWEEGTAHEGPVERKHTFPGGHWNDWQGCGGCQSRSKWAVGEE